MALADKLKNDLEFVARAGRTLYIVEFNDDLGDDEDYDHNWERRHTKATSQTKNQANCWSSECKMLAGYHMPVFDVDLPRTQGVNYNDYPGENHPLTVEQYVEHLVRKHYDHPVEVRWVPSTTEGHHHVYVDWPMEWATYDALLWSLRAANLIENGYYEASVNRSMSFVRLPGVKRPPRKPKPSWVGGEVIPMVDAQPFAAALPYHAVYGEDEPF